MNIWNTYKCLSEPVITFDHGTTGTLLSHYATIPARTIRLQIQSLGAGIIYHKYADAVPLYTAMKQIRSTGQIYIYEWKYDDLCKLYFAADNITDIAVLTFEGPL